MNYVCLTTAQSWRHNRKLLIWQILLSTVASMNPRWANKYQPGVVSQCLQRTPPTRSYWRSTCPSCNTKALPLCFCKIMFKKILVKKCHWTEWQAVRKSFNCTLQQQNKLQHYRDHTRLSSSHLTLNTTVTFKCGLEVTEGHWKLAVSAAILEIFSVKEWPDLEIWVWGPSRLLRMARFDRPCMTFY